MNEDFLILVIQGTVHPKRQSINVVRYITEIGNKIVGVSIVLKSLGMSFYGWLWF